VSFVRLAALALAWVAAVHAATEPPAAPRLIARVYDSHSFFLGAA